ncbi:MAG: YebC/PmpR family DNA-binding transcriptional regulator [Candidatus Sungbacteria bacterium]|nr:YebC/PmpR family DNA-binding transcriptional regulator [Candidatus Sungbacteria bacterium]
MSGHSRWKQIKHKKEAADKKRGGLFSKLAKAITVAARKGTYPEMNTQLRLAIQRARGANMPSENIERAIARSDPAKADAELFEVTYEAYAPGGSALLIEGITDNKNRTAAEIKRILAEHGGKLAETGSVAWMFEKKGMVALKTAENQNLKLPETELLLIDSGAEEIADDADGLTAVLPHETRQQFIKELESRGFTIRESYDAFIPKIKKLIDEGNTDTVEKLIEALEVHDDIQEVWSNIEESR